MIDYNKLISPGIQALAPSGIRKFFDIAAEMKDAISLGVGEPDFATPWHIRTAATDALKQGHTYYTSNWGLIELRNAISDNIKKKYGVSYNPENEILVTVGGSEAIDLAVRALIEPGDEVLIPQPSFVCYEPIVELAGGVPVVIELKADNDFVLTPEQLEEKITEKGLAVV